MNIFFSSIRRTFAVLFFMLISVLFFTQTAEAQVFTGAGAGQQATAVTGPDAAGAVTAPVEAVTGGLSVPVGDTALRITATANLKLNTTRTIKEQVLDGIAYGAASAAVDVVSNAIANKILSSYNAVVRDLNKELSDLVNKVEDKLGIDIGFSNSCFPELPLYQNSQYNKFKFRLNLRCSLEPTNAREFSNDFSKGGWEAYRVAVFEPQNNPFGSYVIVQNELNRRSGQEVEREKQELAWGRGVRSLRDSLTGEIKQPASAIQGHLDDAFGLQMNRLAQPDELSEVVASFTGLLVSQALQDGVFGSGSAFDRL